MSIDRDFEQVSEEHMKSMTKPEGPAQEPQSECPFCGGSGKWKYELPTPPASQPTVTQDAQGELHKALRCVAIDDVRFHINEALALLRAAEQK